MFQNNVRRYVFVLQIDRTLLSMFCTWSVTLWKIVSNEPTYPSEITAFEPPPPSLGISNDLLWGGGGLGIFWNHTFDLVQSLKDSIQVIFFISQMLL